MNKYGPLNSSENGSELNSSLQHNFVPRSSYTNQIMDILKNVTRQKEETGKVKYLNQLKIHFKL